MQQDAGLRSFSVESLGPHLRDLLTEFGRNEPIAAEWEYFPDEGPLGDTEDCDVVSRALVEFLAGHGVHARLVRVEPPAPEPWYGTHYFAVVDGKAIDWTGIQHYNVPDDEREWIDPAFIPVPLVFDWPGAYPLLDLRFVETPQ